MEYRQDASSCTRGEHYQRLPGDIYPSLSAVDRVINRNEAFSWEPDEYYRDLTVPAGVPLTVPSGTVIRVFRHFITKPSTVAGGARVLTEAGFTVYNDTDGCRV